MRYATTQPDVVSPWASTPMDPRGMYERIQGAFERAEKRRAKIPEPRRYWEDHELHGDRREVRLPRGARGSLAALGLEAPRASRSGHTRLPPMPKTSVLDRVDGQTVLLVAGVVGAGALAYWAWKRRQAQPVGMVSLPASVMT